MSLAKARCACRPAGVAELGLILLVAAVETSNGQVWVGETNVTEARPSASDQQACIATDGSGTPWVVWHGYRNDASLLYTRWLGDRWDTAYSVGPDTPPDSVYSRLRPAFAFDGAGRAWAVWHNCFRNNSRDIGSMRWESDRWSAQMQVNLPDSTELDFAPRIASGAGRFWCVWFGGPTDVSRYAVYASEWDESNREWWAEMQVSRTDGNHHWFADVAVDTAGRPHFIWCEAPHRLVLYSFYNGQCWSFPTAVNDTNCVGAPSWIEPHIAIDKSGGIHAVFVGVVPRANHRDVFHARLGAAGWLPAQQVNREGLPDASWCDIEAGETDNIWAAWDRYGSLGDPGMYAARFDGSMWQPEDRLDGDDSFGEIDPRICLDSSDNSWVVWYAYSRSRGNLQVYSNHYALSAVHEPICPTGSLVTLCAAPSRTGGAFLRYTIPDPAVVRFSVVDELGRVRGRREWTQMAGSHEVSMTEMLGTNRKPPAGVYFCRLQARGVEARCRFVLLTE